VAPAPCIRASAPSHSEGRAGRPQQIGMVAAAHAVGQHAGPAQAGPVVLQAMGQRASVPAMAEASTTASTGRPSRSPDRPRRACRRTGPSRLRPGSGRPRRRRHAGARTSASPVIHKSTLCTARRWPARASAGPENPAALEHAHRRPWRACSRASAPSAWSCPGPRPGSDQQRRAACPAPPRSIFMCICLLRATLP
jgi:hypothetical protein